MTRGSQLLEGASLEACSLEALLLAPGEEIPVGGHAGAHEGVGGADPLDQLPGRPAGGAGREGHDAITATT